MIKEKKLKENDLGFYKEIWIGVGLIVGSWNIEFFKRISFKGGRFERMRYRCYCGVTLFYR